MRVHFHGAAGQVTGSLHLVEAAGKRVLLDCGLQQGSQELEAANADPFPFDAASIDALVLSHAHIDHIGRVPLLVRRGFRGPIWTQRATADLVPIMLMDAASLAESDAERQNRRRGAGEPQVVPLYSRDDVRDALELLQPLPYDARTTILDGVTSPCAMPATSSVRRASSSGPTAASWCSPATSGRAARRSCATPRRSARPTCC